MVDCATVNPLPIGLLLFWLCAQPVCAGWSKLENAIYTEGSHSDGDSVEVIYEGKHHIFRLYFVDCLETNPRSRDRRLAQAKYFGIDSKVDKSAMGFGKEAARTTRDLLKKPFTVHTRWEPVSPGNPSIRAFVETSDGQDLGTVLVERGLAIIRSGQALSDHPDGRSKGRILRGLREKETTARVKGSGAWKKQKSTPLLKIPGSLSANETSLLRSMAGHVAKVSGTIATTGALPDNRLTFLNFEGNQRGDFVAIIRGEDLPTVAAAFPGGRLAGLMGARIEVNGLITLHRETPQIEITSPSQLKVLE